MDKLVQTLKNIGLSEKEAQTYMTLLHLGQLPASVLAKKTAQNRSSCYTTLEKLMSRGFVEKVIQENNAQFKAVNPVYVLDQLKTKQYELDSTIENLGLALKDFHQLKNDYENKPKVVFFQDESGLQNVLENTFTSSEPLRCYASLDKLSSMLPAYLPRYYEKRVQKGLRVRAIYPASEQSFTHKKRDKNELRESRLIPQEFNFHLDIMVYDNKVVITSLREKFGVLIESKEMAEAQKKLFDLIWKTTAGYDRLITSYYEKIFRQKFLRSRQKKSPR